MLFFLVIMATAVLFVPSITARSAGQSAWLAALIVPWLAGVLCLSMVWKLGQYFPEQTLAQYSESVMGKVLGKLVTAIFFLFLLIGNILVVREFAELLRIVFMPETPIWVFTLLLTVISGYGAGKGLEVITRAAQFVVPLFVLTLAMVVIFSVPDMEYGRLQPFLEGGVGRIVRGSEAPAVWYGEIVFLAMVLPAVNKPREVFKKGLVLMSVVALLFSTVTAATLAVLGPDLTRGYFFPVLEVARYINIARFLQRMELLVMAFWVIGIVVKAAVFSYLICLTFAQLAGFKDYRPLLFPAGLAQVLGSAFLFGGTLELMDFLGKTWTPVSLAIELGLPMLLLLVAFLRPGIRRGVR